MDVVQTHAPGEPFGEGFEIEHPVRRACIAQLALRERHEGMLIAAAEAGIAGRLAALGRIEQAVSHQGGNHVSHLNALAGAAQTLFAWLAAALLAAAFCES